MRKTHLAIVALGAVLLTGYSGCSGTKQDINANYSTAKNKISATKQAAAEKAHAAKERTEAAAEDAYADLAE